MKTRTKVLCALYVVAVLLFAGTVRAQGFQSEVISMASMQTNVPISQVALSTEGLELLIAGTLPNPCYGKPSAQLVQDPLAPHTLVLRLSSPIPTSMCVTKVMPYKTLVNPPDLAQAAHLQLSDKGVYLLKTEGYPFEIQINASDLMN